MKRVKGQDYIPGNIFVSHCCLAFWICMIYVTVGVIYAMAVSTMYCLRSSAWLCPQSSYNEFQKATLIQIASKLLQTPSSSWIFILLVLEKELFRIFLIFEHLFFIVKYEFLPLLSVVKTRSPMFWRPCMMALWFCQGFPRPGWLALLHCSLDYTNRHDGRWLAKWPEYHSGVLLLQCVGKAGPSNTVTEYQYYWGLATLGRVPLPLRVAKLGRVPLPLRVD